MKGTPQRIAGFLIAATFLIVAADFETTAQIAVAFSYLILLSMLFIAGPAAFANLGRLVGAS